MPGRNPRNSKRLAFFCANAADASTMQTAASSFFISVALGGFSIKAIGDRDALLEISLGYPQFSHQSQDNGGCDFSKLLKKLAPQVGLEPTTLRLTAGCSAIELLRSVVASRRELRLSCHLFYSIRPGERKSCGPGLRPGMCNQSLRCFCPRSCLFQPRILA